MLSDFYNAVITWYIPMVFNASDIFNDAIAVVPIIA